MTSRLDELAHGRENAFDVLRLGAAGLVLVSHSFPLTGRREPLAPHSLGTAGVEIFFAISGFLVTKSWLDEPAAGRFLRKRALRIFPALICAVAVAALVIGPALSTRATGSYFESSRVWDYIGGNILLFPQWLLPGVFGHNPDHAVNGSLWTLPIEFRAYLLVLLFGLAGFVRRAVVVPAAAVAVLLSTGFGLSTAIHLTGVFAGGAALYLLRDRITLRGDLAIVLLVVWLVVYPTRFAAGAGIVALPYLVVFAAYRAPRWLRRVTALGDVSYGVYVYAFPTQQLLVAVLGAISPALLVLGSAPLVWTAGLVSWRLVERPMLRLKRPAGVPAGPRVEPATVP